MKIDFGGNTEVAQALGLTEAIFLNKLEHYQRGTGGKMIDGVRYVWNTFPEWQKLMPYCSVATIERAIYHLQKLGIVKAVQPDGRASRKKYYAINHAELRAFLKDYRAKLAPQNEEMGTPQNDEILNSKSCNARRRKQKWDGLGGQGKDGFRTMISADDEAALQPPQDEDENSGDMRA